MTLRTDIEDLADDATAAEIKPLLLRILRRVADREQRDTVAAKPTQMEHGKHSLGGRNRVRDD